MTDDDDLRDAFGVEIADVLGARVAMTDTDADATVVEHRVRGVRARRRMLAAATVVVVALAGVGIVAATRGHGSGVRVGTIATVPTTAAPTHKTISYQGVHVDVPAAWPVVDGMHTALCGTPFTTVATAFLGPQENSMPGCAAPLPGQTPSYAGVWLQTEPRPTDAQPKTLPSGVVVLASRPDSLRHNEDVWYHGVDIQIGLGSDPRVARAILDSIGYTADAPDTRRAGVCARGDSNVMPPPERLTSRLVIDSHGQILDPPRAGDDPTVSAAQIWATTKPYRQDFEQYRLILTRYTSIYPAAPTPNGYRPTIVDRLAWVVYATPRSPNIRGCGEWQVGSFDALTGAALLESSYGTGP